MSLARAIETGDATLLPGRRDEDWRWTDLRGLIRTLPPASPAAEALGSGPFDALATDRIVVVNGLGAKDIVVPAGERRTVDLRFVSRADGTAHHVALNIDVAARGSLVLLESYEGQGTGYIADAEISISLGVGASIERIVLASDAADAVSVSQATVVVSDQATFAQTVLTDGARRQRLETQVSHPGGGAQVRLDGAYLIADKRFADLTTGVTHKGAEGVTSELVKGAVAGQGRAVFQGRIVVAEGADQTDARMGHHALILSDRGEVDAKPELLIYADDVSCAHGNTVGALDQDALFYARQRGIPEAEAKALLTEAFVGEVIDRIEHEGAREVCRAWVAEKLRGLA
jgi:Fe-S cluster assembly protein SufD